jgi:hypothetical protein
MRGARRPHVALHTSRGSRGLPGPRDRLIGRRKSARQVIVDCLAREAVDIGDPAGLELAPLDESANGLRRNLQLVRNVSGTQQLLSQRIDQSYASTEWSTIISQRLEILAAGRLKEE